MAIIKLRHKCQVIPGIPYVIFFDSRPAAIMDKNTALAIVPKGPTLMSVKLMFPIYKWRFSLSSQKEIFIRDQNTEIEFGNHQMIWNVLFDLDLVLWIISLFLTIPEKWDTIYTIVSNVFFVVWLIHLWITRNNYFYIKERIISQKNE